MRGALSLLCASALFSTTALSPAFAQTQVPAQVPAQAVPVVSLDPVTVYATRSPQSTFDVPAMVSKIEADGPGNALAGNVEDLLEFTTGVEVSNGPRRNGQTITIRGFDDEAIITLFDGRRQNFEAEHDGRFFIDPALLKSVEIVKGAASAIYGGGAIGGVVAFETKEASDLLAPGDDFGVLTTIGGRTANDELSSLVSGFGRVGNWDLLASIAYKKSDDIELGNGAKLETRDKILSGLFKLGYTFDDVHTVKFLYQGLKNDSTEPNNGGGALTTSNPIVEKDVRDDQFSVKYQYDNPANTWLSPKLHLYYNETEVEERDITGSNNGRVQVRKIETTGFTADNQSRLTVNEGHNHTLSYGFEIYHDDQNGSNTFAPVRAGVPEADATNYGFYLQDEITLETSAGHFLIIPAVRFDKYESDDAAGNSQDESEASPKLSLSYKPTPNFVFFGSAARAFRAPNLTELYPSGRHFPGGGPVPDNFFVPNPNLKPETVTTYEIGAGLKFDNIVSGNDRIKIKGVWFHSDGDDFITQEVDVFAGTTLNFNIPNAELRGYEIEGEFRINHLTTKLGLSYVKAEDEDTGNYLPNVVPLTLVSDVSYQFVGLDSTLGWRGRFVRNNNKVAPGETPNDGYAVHDIYFRWMPESHGLDALTVDLGVENMFDKAYTKRFASLLSEGRSYVARVAYQW